MSDQSNNRGRAYEFICLIVLQEEIQKVRNARIEENSNYFAALRAWESIDEQLQSILYDSAKAAVYTIFDLEPLILDDGDDALDLKIQADTKGEVGDPRDILVIRRGIEWEIGLSIKHNHFAVKHSRLGRNLDFAQRWFGHECTADYWNEIKPIFEYLEEEKSNKKLWSELPSKENDVYIPLLKAFVNELKRNNEMYPDMPKKMVEYLLGQFDFYKVISIDNKSLTQIQTYNLRGTLNKPSKARKPKIVIPVSELPSRIVSLDFKPGSTNTVELYMDAGWQFGFRIHNASSRVETSLKFDIQLIGMPATIISINCKWND